MKKLFLILFSLSFLSCATKIVRWTDGSDEQRSRSLESSKNESIFADFLWTTPPVSSRKIDTSFEYAGESYSFEVQEDQLIIQKDGVSYPFDIKESDNTIYPNTKYLEPYTKQVRKWVPKTTTKVETVPVMKTRTVPVTTTGANGMTSTSFQTESYTDFETRVVTQTDWVWETQTEYAYRIPSFDYYEVKIDGNLFYVYVIDNEYYIQNPSYLMCKESNESFWGEKEMNLLFIDSNANGTFLEPEDHILFNIWNPYDPNDSYKEISHLMDNRWYYNDVLKEDLFLDFSLQGDKINIAYLNERYIGTEDWGSLTVSGIQDLDTDIYVNGKRYRIKDGKPVKSEYGNFNVKILLENHLDYFKSILIDEQNPDGRIAYELTEEATLLKIKNLFSSNYFVTVKNGDYSKTYYNVKEINIPLGENTIEIRVNGFLLSKVINTTHAEKIEIDFENEIKKL